MSSETPSDEGTKGAGEPRLMSWLNVGPVRRDDSPEDGASSTVGSTGGGASEAGDGAERAEAPGVGYLQTVPDDDDSRGGHGSDAAAPRPFDDLDDRADEPVAEAGPTVPAEPVTAADDSDDSDDGAGRTDLDDMSGTGGASPQPSDEQDGDDVDAADDADESNDGQPASLPSSWDELLGALSSPAASTTSTTGSTRASKKAGRWGRSGKASRTARTGSDKAGRADADAETPSPAKTRPSKKKRASGASRGPVGRPAGFGAAGSSSRRNAGPGRSGGGRRRVPVWARRGIVAGVVVVLIVGAVVGGQALMGDQTPVTSTADHPVQTSVPPMQSQVTSQPPTPGHKDDAGLPDRDVPVYAGQCNADQLPRGAEQISGSHKDLRSAAAAFQEEYFAHNAEGVKALIDDSNKAWKGQDWGKVLDSIPADATYCLTMPAVKSSMSTVTATLTMSTPGADDQTFKQKITGTSHDNLWQIKRMDPID